MSELSVWTKILVITDTTFDQGDMDSITADCRSRLRSVNRYSQLSEKNVYLFVH